jgi:hypothetical protein
MLSRQTTPSKTQRMSMEMTLQSLLSLTFARELHCSEDFFTTHPCMHLFFFSSLCLGFATESLRVCAFLLFVASSSGVMPKLIDNTTHWAHSRFDGQKEQTIVAPQCLRPF